VRLFGARRTMVLAQVLAGVTGALLFLLSQAYNLMPRGNRDAVAADTAHALMQHGVLAPASPLWLPGRAALGDALPLLGLVALALVAYLLTVGRTHRFFVHGLQQAAAIGHAAPKPAGGVRFRFRSSLFETVVIKEWRLIVRDPHLISQVLLQLIYLVPLLVLILRGSDTPGPLVGTGLTMLCSSLAASLAWIVIAAEDAPDLLRAAPAAARTVRLAKLAAATMPPLLLVALPLLWLIARAPLSGLLAAFTVTGAVLSAGLITLWIGRPAVRSNFQKRGKENIAGTILDLLSTLSWAGLSFTLVSLTSAGATWTLIAAPIALAVALAALLTAWLFRRRTQ
jgi:ABC-2 type transport system permease protein